MKIILFIIFLTIALFFLETRKYRIGFLQERYLRMMCANAKDEHIFICREHQERMFSTSSRLNILRDFARNY